MYRCIIRTLFCLAFVQTASPIWGQWDGQRLPGAKKDWIQIESPNFEVFTDRPEWFGRATLHDLETLRAIFLEQLGVAEKHRIQVSIFAFSDGRDYRFYTRKSIDDRRETAGVYVTSPDRATIVLRPMDGQDSARRVVFHEFVHHLFRVVGTEPPIWFNEGTAELYSGIRFDGDEVTIGMPHTDLVEILRRRKLLPLEELFAVDEDSHHYNRNDHAGLFYAQSWALLHYWRFGDSKLAMEDVKRFLTVAGQRDRLSKTNIRSLFEECFGMDFRKMESRLKRYVHKGRYTYGTVPAPDIPERSTYTRTDLTTGQTRMRLAELATRTRGEPLGRLALLEAVASDTQDPRVFEVLGSDAKLANKLELALEYWQQAYEFGSANHVIMTELARERWQTWFSDYTSSLRLPAAEADYNRDLLLTSIRLEPEQTEAYELLAWIEGFAEDPKPANLNLVQERFPLLKEKARTVLAIAMSRKRLDMEERAISILEAIGKFEPDVWTLHAAEQTLAEWKGRTTNEVYLGQVGNVRTEVAQLKQSFTRIPSVPVPLDLGEPDDS